MTNFSKNQNQGFLLIEAVLYIVLFSFIVVGSFYSFFSFLDNSTKLSDKVLVLEEGEFILKKIEFLITSAEEIIEPSYGKTSQKLTLNTNNPLENPLTLELLDNSIFLKRGGQEHNFLNSSRLSVDNLMFENLELESSEVQIIKFFFTVNGEEFKSVQIKYD